LCNLIFFSYKVEYALEGDISESRVHHPIDYARVVQKIGNEMDLTLVHFKGILPSADIMWIRLAESTTSGETPSEENLAKKTGILTLIQQS
jgi:hypothetical protein